MYFLGNLVRAGPCFLNSRVIKRRNVHSECMKEINYFTGRALVRDFHTRCLYQKSQSLAALARSVSDTSPTRAKIPYARPAHEVISIFNVINNEESPKSIKDLIEHRNNKIKTHSRENNDILMRLMANSSKYSLKSWRFTGPKLSMEFNTQFI